MNEFNPRPELPVTPNSEHYEPGQAEVEFRFAPNDDEPDGVDPAAIYDVSLGASGENPMAVLSSCDGYGASEIVDPAATSDAHTEQAEAEITDQSNEDTEGFDDDDLFKQIIQEAFGEAADNQEIALDLVFPGAGAPPIVPPSDNHDLGSGELPERPEGGGNGPEPTLGVGEIIEYTLAESEYSTIAPIDDEPIATSSIAERVDQIVTETDEFREYDGEIDRRTIDVASDTTVIARGSDEHPITLAAGAREGLVITFQHPATGEGAIININSSTAGTYQQVELVQSALQATGAFSSEGVVIHVFGGNQELITTDGVTMSYADGVANYLRDIEMLPNVTVAHDAQGEIEVTMSVHSGAPEARVGGVVVYPYPEDIQEETPVLEAAEADTTASDSDDRTEDTGRWSYLLNRADSLIAEPTSPQTFITDILPASLRRAKAAETTARRVTTDYAIQARSLDANTSPEDRVALLDSHFPSGQDGLDALTYMIQHRSATLEELGGPENQIDPLLVVDLLVSRLDSAYDEVDKRIRILASDSRDETIAERQFMIERRVHLGAKLDQANRLRDRYMRGTK